MTPVDLSVRARIARLGSLGFDEVVEAALYDPDGGFYAGEGRAGRRGDFLTSPEVGPLFGAVVARALDAWWDDAGRPDTFVVVEAGAGPGALARSILAAQPACTDALRYVLVERSAPQRTLHGQGLPLEDPASAFASKPDPDEDRRRPAEELPAGPIAVSLATLPRLPGPCVVIANELLDNLAFGLVERTADSWAEVRVGIDDSDRLVEVLVPLPQGRVDELCELAPSAAPGARLPTQAAATAWLHDAVALAGDGGRVLVFDYAAPSGALAGRPWTDWVRTYHQHSRGGHPLSDLGTQDITCEVAVDQLVPAPCSDRSQAEWLRAHGIDELVEEGRRTWRERAHIGDLAALRGRSRSSEAEALLDDGGLGSFRVLEWSR